MLSYPVVSVQPSTHATKHSNSDNFFNWTRRLLSPLSSVLLKLHGGATTTAPNYAHKVFLQTHTHPTSHKP